MQDEQFRLTHVEGRAGDRLAQAPALHVGKTSRWPASLFKVFSGIALECNRDERKLRVRRIGSCPCEQAGRQNSRFIGPMSLQPCGQVPCRAIHCAPCLAPSRQSTCATSKNFEQTLTLLPLDQLKIDQSFVRNIGIQRTDALIAPTIIGMAQRAFLERHGCTLWQGSLFRCPVPIEALGQRLHSGLGWQVSS